MQSFLSTFYERTGKIFSYGIIIGITSIYFLAHLFANEFTFYSNILEQAGIIEKPYTASTPILRRDAFRIAVGIG